MSSWKFLALWLIIEADVLGKYSFSSPHITPHKLPLNHGAGTLSAQLTVLGRKLPTLASTPDKSDQELL